MKAKITERALEKCGFNYLKTDESKDAYYVKLWGDNGYETIVKSIKYNGKYEYQLGRGRVKILEFMWQLKVLYFALTGERLR